MSMVLFGIERGSKQLGGGHVRLHSAERKARKIVVNLLPKLQHQVEVWLLSLVELHSGTPRSQIGTECCLLKP